MVALQKTLVTYTAATVCLLASLSLHAANFTPLALPVVKPAGPVAQSLSAAAQVASLQSAYSTLAGANHDYGNHRVLAMQAIAQACTILGGSVSGGGKGGEWQIVSDIQLHQAQATLQLMRAGIAPGNQPRVAALVDSAINQINLALAVN